MAEESKEIGRRDFLKGLGAGVIGGGLVIGGVFTGTRTGIVSAVGTNNVRKLSAPASGGYILVDSKKCAGCQSCMLACSLVHEGKENTTLSRIQVLWNSLGNYPNDIAIRQCRQCVYPSCVYACPTGALSFDQQSGTRLVNQDACIGCQRCLEACPQMPSRIVWDSADGKAEKCDLCLGAKYWNQKGGPDGKQACVEVCPMKAIKFTSTIPAQVGTVGYETDLRSSNYLSLVAPTPNTTTPAPPATTTTPPATTTPPKT